MPSPTDRPWFKDWTQYLCPGPARRFSAEQMARGGQQPWPKGIDQYVVYSSLLLALFGLLFKWSATLWALAALSALLIGSLSLWAGRRLWRSPTRLRLNLTSFLGTFVLAAGVMLPERLPELERVQRQAYGLSLAMVFVAVQSAFWFLTLYRVQQIEARLRELDDQAAQQRLMNRLATAQIHPHFVFNTLASLTQWVETGDARAAPLLREFAAYLRATLPMFERESQALGEELDLLRHYLNIMAARLGERLQWQVEVDDALRSLPLPPGSLLTLVENAITHGVEPSLRGGCIVLTGRRAQGRVRLVVRNSGADLVAGSREGLGLSNTRQRLLALHPQAQLRLAPLPEGGCVAELELPDPCPESPA